MKNSLPYLLAAVGMLLAPVRSVASDSAWLEAKSPHFTLYTDASEPAARRLIDQFETARRSLRPALRWVGTAERPIRIVAFRSTEEMEPYAPHQLAAGFFLAGDADDFIVMAATAVNSRTAAHEYCHAVLAQNGLRLPPWLNEGLAEVYSRTPEGDVPSAWAPLSEFLDATYSSPLFQNPAIVQKSYAECWLIGHMLVFDPRYAPHLGELIAALDSGSGTGLLPKIYGKPLPEIEKDLARYRTAGASLHRPMTAQAEPPLLEIRRSANLEAGLTLAELLSHYRGHHEQAREVYDRLEREFPLEAAVELGIANLCVRDGNPTQAAVHRALAKEYALAGKADQ